MWPQDFDGKTMQHFGLIGDYLGGVWGTAIGAVTLLVVLATYLGTRKADTRNRVLGVLTQMLQTHDNIVASAGYDARLILREFSAIYKVTRRVCANDQTWSLDDRVNIAYTAMFYGLNSEAARSLSRHGEDDIKRVLDAVSKLRDAQKGKFHRLFSGHQASLSHLMRNLYAMFVLLDRSAISRSDKLELAKVIRAKLSNYDQAVLALNILSFIGREWETDGILDRFKPIANIPKHFFGFDPQFDLKAVFPTVPFEWERIDLRRPRYRTFAFGGFGFTFSY